MTIDKIKKRKIIDRRNNVEMTIYKTATGAGTRFGFDLAVAETDPFVEWAADEGFCSATEAEREARKQYAAFRTGDELCQGVYKS